jgi:hypothetical protein
MNSPEDALQLMTDALEYLDGTPHGLTATYLDHAICLLKQDLGLTVPDIPETPEH